jgi:hypothetical protein
MGNYASPTRIQRLMLAGLDDTSAAHELEIEQVTVLDWREGTKEPPRWVIPALERLADQPRRGGLSVAHRS